MKAVNSQRKFETIRHKTMHWDEHNETFPSERIALKDGVYINKNYIPYDHETTKIIYFVDGTNGDSYGQYSTVEGARARFDYLLTLSNEDRRKEDY